MHSLTRHLLATAAIALFRFKAGVIPVILACGTAGLALRVLAPV